MLLQQMSPTLTYSLGSMTHGIASCYDPVHVDSFSMNFLLEQSKLRGPSG